MAVALMAICWGILAMAAWISVPHWPADGVDLVAPLAPGHAIEFDLWTHDLEFSPAFTTGGLTRQRPGPLRLTVWYQHVASGTNQRLAVLRMPTWPLMLLAGSAALVSTGLWPRSATRHSRTPS